jgi:hypothetical protein
MDSPWAEEANLKHSKILADSYYYWTKKELIARNLDEVQTSFLLYHASFVVVSHGIDNDPIFNYANLKAQELWKLNWDQFTSMPSRLSAEQVQEADRKKILEEAEKSGYITDYSGIRISSESKKFKIENTTLWNVVDAKGLYLGQAAMFPKWVFL